MKTVDKRVSEAKSQIAPFFITTTLLICVVLETLGLFSCFLWLLSIVTTAAFEDLTKLWSLFPCSIVSCILAMAFIYTIKLGVIFKGNGKESTTQNILELDEQDIVTAVAAHHNCDAKDVILTLEMQTVGRALDKHTKPKITAKITKTVERTVKDTIGGERNDH